MLMSDSSQSILKLNKKTIDFRIITWEFYIGGYQPAQNWLKDRKGKKLKFEDSPTLSEYYCSPKRLMKEIDKV